jgi:hypothetical protein
MSLPIVLFPEGCVAILFNTRFVLMLLLVMILFPSARVQDDSAKAADPLVRVLVTEVA